MNYKLQLLDVCLPDYFQGYSGKFNTVIAFVDNKTTVKEVLNDIVYNTNNEDREESFWNAFDSAIGNARKTLNLDAIAFPDLSDCECTDRENHYCESVIAYFTIEREEQ